MTNVTQLHPDLPPREQARAACAVFDRGCGDRDQALRWLAWAFHVLHDAPGLYPEWQPTKFWKWAKGHSSSTRQAALFVLNVWNPNPWGKRRPYPKFLLQDAYGVWDHLNRQAFLGWAEEPWWP